MKNDIDTDLLTIIGTKPQLKNRLKKLSESDFKKFKKITFSAIEDVEKQREEEALIQTQKKEAIEKQLQILAKEHGIQLSDLKAHINNG